MRNKILISVLLVLILLLSMSHTTLALTALDAEDVEATEESQEADDIGADTATSDETVDALEDNPASIGTPARLYLFRENQTLTMPKNTVSYWFIVPDGMSLDSECTLKLRMAHSVTIINELSAVTVYVNDTAIETWTINASQNTLSREITFDSSLIRTEGFNELKIVLVQRSIEGDCADIDNPFNWSVIYKDSYIDLYAKPAKQPVLSAYYPLYYDTFSEQFTIAKDYVLSNVNKPGIIESMLGLSNASGMHYADKEYIRTKVYTGNNGSLSKNNKIFIGLSEDSMAWSKELLSYPESVNNDNGYVSINGYTDNHPYYKMLLLGQNEIGLKKATSFLANRTLVGQTDMQDIYLHSDIKGESVRGGMALNETGLYSFSDFGYTDLNLAGAFRHRAELSFVQINGIRGDEGSYMEVSFRHSAALLSDRSAMTVYINNIPIDSVKLSPANAQGGSLIIDIPKSALNQPIINVSIETYHYLGKVDCTKDYYDVAWTVIDADNSKIFFKESQHSLEPTLSGFPNFTSIGQASHVALYMSEQTNEQALEIASMLAARTGQNTGRIFNWEMKADSIVSNPNGDIIVFGKSDSFSLPDEIQTKLTIVPDGKSYTIRDEELSIIPEILSDKAIIQVIRSPWDFYKKVYVVLYDNETSLAGLKKLLGKRTLLNEMAMQICIIGKDGTVTSYGVEYQEDDNKIQMTFRDYTKQAEAYTGLPLWAMVLAIVVVLILIVTIIRLLKHKHDEYKHAGDKHRDEQGIFRQDQIEKRSRKKNKK